MKRYYIAYGSNLNIRQMRIRCPHARVIGTAVINDYELLFKGSRTGAYLTIEPKEGGEVPVVVWEVTESDEAALDRYEGYPVFYYKKEMELDIRGIRTGKIRRSKCFVYIRLGCIIFQGKFCLCCCDCCLVSLYTGIGIYT